MYEIFSGIFFPLLRLSHPVNSSRSPPGSHGIFRLSLGAVSPSWPQHLPLQHTATSPVFELTPCGWYGHINRAWHLSKPSAPVGTAQGLGGTPPGLLAKHHGASPGHRGDQGHMVTPLPCKDGAATLTELLGFPSNTRC